jgi:hypothetical protein
MGNLAGLKHIVQAALILTFADLACMDAAKANDLLERYPDYRNAKDQVEHEFWVDGGVQMLAEVNSALALAELHSQIELDECA